MEKDSYAKNRKEHLETYAKEKNLPVGGKWQGKGNYSHILEFDGDIEKPQNRENKYKVVCEKNILSGVLTDMFFLNDMHKYAHHLNSSQVLCYNFFRALITEHGNPTNQLIGLLKNQDIYIHASAICKFEYCQNPKEKTQFDFYIEDGDIKVFFEIKYTEYGFGKAEKDLQHEEKLKTTYNDFFNKQKCLKEIPDCEEFVNHYQLYRNVIRITDNNKYVVLLYPKANEKAEEEAKSFISGKIKEEYKGNILCLYWEDIVEKDSELYRKYFAERMS